MNVMKTIIKGGICMKSQWGWLIALLFAVIIAVFSVVNVAAVTVSYVFGVVNIPLVLIILISALLGALISGILTTIRAVKNKRKAAHLEKEVTQLQEELRSKNRLIEEQKRELIRLEKLEATKVESTPTQQIATEQEPIQIEETKRLEE